MTKKNHIGTAQWKDTNKIGIFEKERHPGKTNEIFPAKMLWIKGKQVC